MKRFLVLHFGFEPPTPEQMEAWNQWFDAIADRQVERAHLPEGRELTAAGTKELPFGKDSLTGYTILEAPDLDAAEEIVRGCPIVASTRVYEIRA